jgi:hypothetical protein
MTYRLLAVLGSIAFGIRQLFASLLSFVGLRELARLGVPLVIVALAAATVISARDTAAILAERPEVQHTTLADVAALEDPTGSIWFEFDAVMAQSSFATPAAFFYLARDPEDQSTGLLVRSSLGDAFIRQRVVSAELVPDADLIAAAIEALGPLPSGFDLDAARFLDEVDYGGEPDEAFIPSQLAAEPDGSQPLVTGRVVTPATYAACAVESGCDGDDAAWFYYLADPEGADAMVLRSPHPPDAQPIRLQGLYARDTFDLAPVLDSDWYAGLDARVPIDRAFAAGSRPPITVEASWVPTIIFGALTLLLLASQLVGYPVFGGRAGARPGRSLQPGEGVDVVITGRLERPSRALELDGSPGAVERLSIPDLALRMWRYGVLPRDLSRREAEERFMADARGEADRLVLHERDQSALVSIAHTEADVRVDVGRLYRVASSAPAVHLRQAKTDAYLSFASAQLRDRVAAEIRGEAGGSRPPTPAGSPAVDR